MNWYKHYIGDYQRDTGHLSMIEHGAYRLLLDTHYATEKPIPKTQSVLFRLLRALSVDEQAAVLSVLARFWTETDDGYVNDRALIEFEKISNKINAARENGNLGGRPKKTHDITETKTETITETITETKPAAKAPQTPDTRHQTSNPLNPPRGAVSRESEFETWWCQYPRRVGKGQALKAYTHARLKTDAQTLLNGAMRYAAERAGEDVRYTKHPATWLNGQCWLDEPEVKDGKANRGRGVDFAAQRDADTAAVLRASGFNPDMAENVGEGAVSRTGEGSAGNGRIIDGGNPGGTPGTGTDGPQDPRGGDVEAGEVLPGVRDDVRHGRADGDLPGELQPPPGGFVARSDHTSGEGLEVSNTPQTGGFDSNRGGRIAATQSASAPRADRTAGDVDLLEIPDFLRRKA